MALSERTDQLIKDYIRASFPELEEGVRTYLEDELQKIELTLQSLADASITVADDAPDKPRRGMVRFATTGWEPLGDGTTNFLVVYNGTAWVAV